MHYELWPRTVLADCGVRWKISESFWHENLTNHICDNVARRRTVRLHAAPNWQNKLRDNSQQLTSTTLHWSPWGHSVSTFARTHVRKHSRTHARTHALTTVSCGGVALRLGRWLALTRSYLGRDYRDISYRQRCLLANKTSPKSQVWRGTDNDDVALIGSVDELQVSPWHSRLTWMRGWSCRCQRIWRGHDASMWVWWLTRDRNSEVREVAGSRLSTGWRHGRPEYCLRWLAKSTRWLKWKLHAIHVSVNNVNVHSYDF